MQKVLFIVPPNISESDFLRPADNVKVRVSSTGRRYGHVLTDPPLGVLSLAAYLHKHTDAEIQLLDFNIRLNVTDDFEFDCLSDIFKSEVDKFRDFQPTIVGLSALFSPSFDSVLEIGAYCREIFPDALIIAGGNMPTAAYKEIYESSTCFDAVCYGEGELSMKSLLLSDDPMAALDSDPSWVTARKMAENHPFKRSFIYDLDEIPFDYSIIDMDDYQINPTVKSFASFEKRGKTVTLMTSRGCPFKCVFCASHKTHGREMRYHSLERMKEDISRIKNEYGVTTITFQDDHLMGDKERAYQIVRHLADEGMSGYFPNSLALYALDRRMLEGLHAAGVEQLTLAVESGSDRVLRKVMKKPLKLEFVRRVADDCRDLGIYTDCNILVGLPGETKEDIADSRAFLRTVNANWFRVYVATPLFGSEMYETSVENDYFVEPVLQANYKHAVLATEDWSAEYIQDIAYVMNLELNFVYNADMRLGCWDVALRGFETALRARPDHVLAHYYAAICNRELGDIAESERHMELARAFAANPFWHRYIEMFELPLDTSSAEAPPAFVFDGGSPDARFTRLGGVAAL